VQSRDDVIPIGPVRHPQFFIAWNTQGKHEGGNGDRRSRVGEKEIDKLSDP
jgi:hypothetical protein